MFVEIVDEKQLRRQVINTDAIANALYDGKSRKILIWFIGTDVTRVRASIEVSGNAAVELAAILSSESSRNRHKWLPKDDPANSQT